MHISNANIDSETLLQKHIYLTFVSKLLEVTLPCLHLFLIFPEGQDKPHYFCTCDLNALNLKYL